MMRLSLAAVATLTLLVILGPLGDLPAGAQPPADRSQAPATMPATAPAAASAQPEGSYAYIVPSKPGAEKKGGLTIVESPLMADGARTSPDRENVQLRRQVETLQIQNNVLRDQVARYVSPYDVVRAALRDGLPLTGDVAAWVCEFGPGHPTLCPSKYIVTSLAPPAPNGP